MNIDKLVSNITRMILIFGFCPVETKLTDGLPEKHSLKIVFPLTIKPEGGIEVDPITNKVLRIHQQVGSEKNTIEGKDLAWFNYCQLGNDPRGFSLIASGIDILNNLNSAIEDVEKIMERFIGPIGIWKTKGPIDSLKQAVMERNPGEDFFLGKLCDEDLQNPDFPKFLETDPRIPYWEYVEYLDRRLYSHYRANSVWYSRDATQASAEVMDDIVQRHVAAIQREVKRSIEEYWFTPLVKLNGLSEVPKIVWGRELTGVEDIQIEPFLTKGLELGFINENVYNEILKQLGLKIAQKQTEEEDEEDEEPEIDPLTGLPKSKKKTEQPVEDDDTTTIESRSKLKEYMQSSQGSQSATWRCPRCGYTILNALSTPYPCPKCAWTPGQPTGNPVLDNNSDLDADFTGTINLKKVIK